MSQQPKSKSLAELLAELAAGVDGCREDLRGVTEQDRQEAGDTVAGMAQSIEVGEHSLSKIDAMEKACVFMLELTPGDDCPAEVKELVSEMQGLFRMLHGERTNPGTGDSARC